METAPVLKQPDVRTFEAAPEVGQTVLEMMAQPVEAYGPVPLEGRQPTSQPSQERTWDPQANRPDSR